MPSRASAHPLEPTVARGVAQIPPGVRRVTQATAGVGDRRRRSIATAQPGSGKVRSPASDLVDLRISPRPFTRITVVNRHGGLVQVQLRPADSQRLPDPHTGREHEAGQVRQVLPPLHRVSRQLRQPRTPFLGVRTKVRGRGVGGLALIPRRRDGPVRSATAGLGVPNGPALKRRPATQVGGQRAGDKPSRFSGVVRPGGLVAC